MPSAEYISIPNIIIIVSLGWEATSSLFVFSYTFSGATFHVAVSNGCVDDDDSGKKL